jgi:hypothetical protein
MSDFLVSLIARAENRAPVLQRRQRALFEAGSISNDLPVASDVAVDSDRGVRFEARPSSVVPEGAHSRQVPRDSFPAIEHSDSHVDARPVHRVSGRDADLPRPRSSQERRAERPEPIYRQMVAPTERPTEQTHSIATRVVDAHIDRRRVERTVARVESPHSTVVKRGTERATAAHDEHRRSPRARVESAPAAPMRGARVEAKDQAPPPPRATTVPTKRASTTTAVMLARAQSSKSVAPPIAPVPAPVHISIGRVEVRATSASQSAVRPAKNAGPRLKLDDYLNDRNRGGR